VRPADDGEPVLVQEPAGHVDAEQEAGAARRRAPPRLPLVVGIWPEQVAHRALHTHTDAQLYARDNRHSLTGNSLTHSFLYSCLSRYIF